MYKYKINSTFISKRQRQPKNFYIKIRGNPPRVSLMGVQSQIQP